MPASTQSATRRSSARSRPPVRRWCGFLHQAGRVQFARQGFTKIEFPVYDTDWDSEAYLTVAGQNSNNSVSLTDDFLRAVEADKDWNLTARVTGKVAKTLKARDLWEKIGEAAWASADPGLHFKHHDERLAHLPAGGRIRASNPCSEYMFLDDRLVT